ncbi:AAA family ATPase, partial [Enterobacter hormaechei]|nr:AAA family ATPase [Enterobacter hormaechei]
VSWQHHLEVEPLSTPPTNVHAIIGRNGVGKTTLLNEMINCILDSSKENSSYFIDNVSLFSQKKINKTYFSSIISISFSAFDPFNPPQEQPDPTKGTCYFYLGLKKTAGDVGVSQLRTIDELREECVSSLIVCFSDKIKKGRWMKAISTLESDNNFLAMNLSELFEISDDKELRSKFMRLLRKMSSGHAIVLLTITKLVEKAEEKTLVLIDEPESHLHPPLLSAFTRALSDLLIDRNGVSIIATHSPVLLQEIPKMCTWVINRYGKQISVARPTIETFGENVGLLTREVFRLEVENSGYHSLLKKHVDNGECFNEIMAKYKNKIGLEGQALLRTMISLHQKDEGEE